MLEQFFKTLLLKPFLISFILVFAITPLAIIFAKKFGLIDDPATRKGPHTHEKPLPRGGGLAIYLGFVIVAMIFLPMTKQIIGILLAGAALVVIGLLDDKYDLSPTKRFVANFVIAGLVVGVGLGIPFINNPLTGKIIDLSQPAICFSAFGNTHCIWILADLLSLFWIVWMMNMVNWSKGVDGQMPGIVGITAFILAIVAFRFTERDITQWQNATFAAAVAGAFFGFLPWNFYPQRIMPGYGGGSLGGFLLAVIAIFSGGKIATAILVLGIPFIDALFTVFRRIWNGASPFKGDAQHLHHRLLEAGWGRRRIALFYYLLSVILGAAALLISPKEKVYFIIFIILFFFGLIIWLKLFSIFLKRQDPDNG
jgi:UDP-GlcNAc:undecaprenyl-phosphate GlcNAc-1-phosphate transferase